MIPTYSITLEDYDAGIFAISLVDKPAIESDFIYMSADEVVQRFAFMDEEKGEIVGAILIPDQLIFRHDEQRGDYYVIFSKDVIKEINERMQETNGNKYFTIQHEMSVDGGGVKFLESWIKETPADKSNQLGLDVPQGSLIVKVKIESEFLKTNIKDGNLNGFSVEIQSSLVLTNFNKIENKNSMDYKEMYKNSVTVNDEELIFSAEKLDKGVVLFSVQDDKLNAYTGNFRIENTNYNVVDGLVTEVENIELSIQEKIEALTAAVADLTNKVAETPEVEEGEVTVKEQLESIMTAMAEQKLANEQKVNEEKVIVEDAQKFSAEDYKTNSEWIEKWY